MEHGLIFVESWKLKSLAYIWDPRVNVCFREKEQVAIYPILLLSNYFWNRVVCLPAVDVWPLPPPVLKLSLINDLLRSVIKPVRLRNIKISGWLLPQYYPLPILQYWVAYCNITPCRYIPSEKIGQNIDPLRNSFFVANYQHWTSTSALGPFLGPLDPWGALGGPWVVWGGLTTPKLPFSFEDQFKPWNWLFWLITTSYTMFLRFWVKMGPSGPKKCSFWPK